MKKEKYATYRILPDLNLVILSYHGSINITDLMHLSVKLFGDNAFKPEYDIFICFRHCNMIAFRLDLMDYVEFFNKSMKLEKKVRLGLLVVSVNQEFLAKIYKNFEKLLNLDIAYFKNLEPYFEWMNFNDSERTLFADAMTSINEEASANISAL